MPKLDLDYVRAQFPALSEHWPDWVLMDNAGGSVAPRQVSDRISDYLRRYMVQLGAGYALSHTATSTVAAAHAFAATLIGARPEEVALGASTTTNAKLLAAALRPSWRSGDVVVVSQLDHEANIGPWMALAETGIEVRMWPIERESAALELDDLRPLLDERVRLVCMTHCANVVGRIHDIPAVAALVHEAGAQLCVDGVAYAPHRLVDVAALDVDYYLLSLYKVYGPHLGLLYGRAELLASAASQNHYFLPADAMPYKLEPGGANHELCAGLAGIGDYLRAVAEHHHHRSTTELRDTMAAAFELFADHEQQLAERLLAYLREHPKVRIIGPSSSDAGLRVPTIAFTVAGRKASEIPEALDKRKLAIRWGHFYALRAIEALDLAAAEGVIRVSMVHYNTLAEVDRLIAALDEIL